MRRRIGKVCAALLVASGSIAAVSVQADVDVHQLLGTWECHGPGQTHPMKPPIMWFGSADNGVGVDGFAGALYGHADVTGSADASMRIALKTGEGVTVSDLADNGRTASMMLHRDAGADYRCNRLPRFN